MSLSEFEFNINFCLASSLFRYKWVFLQDAPQPEESGGDEETSMPLQPFVPLVERYLAASSEPYSAISSTTVPEIIGELLAFML